MDVPSSDFKIVHYTSPTTTSPGPQPITLNNSSTWTHCGPILDLTSLPLTFHTWAQATVNGDLLPSLVPFLAFVHSFLAQIQLSHYCLTIRATRFTHDFDTPRWHTDRNFFDADAEAGGSAHWKLAAALVGPGTLFLADGAKARAVQKKTRRTVRASKTAKEHECRAFKCLGCADMQEAVRVKLAASMQGWRVEQAQEGECVVFRVGDECGAVHSEPVCHGDRVFVHVVPGSEEELRRLAKKWGMEYPRAWAIGVPLNL